MLFNLTKPARAGYADRTSSEALPDYQKKRMLKRLPRDFMEVDRRAREIAKSEIRTAELSLKARQIRFTLIAAFLAVAFSIAGGLITRSWNLETEAMKTQIGDLNAELKEIKGTLRLQPRVDKLEGQVRQLEEK